MADSKCRWCGRDINWESVKGKWVPIGTNGSRHVCPPGTRRSAVSAALGSLQFVGFVVEPGVGRVAKRPVPGAKTSLVPSPKPRLTDAQVLAMLRGVAERPPAPRPPSEPVRRPSRAPISRVGGTPAAIALPGARPLATKRPSDAQPSANATVDGARSSRPVPPDRQCAFCGRRGRIDIVAPHFARSMEDLAMIAEERGGRWHAAYCFPRNRMMVRLDDYEPKGKSHIHDLACGVRTTKTTYRARPS